MLNYRNYIDCGYSGYFNRASCQGGFSKVELDSLRRQNISTIIDLRRHRSNQGSLDFDNDNYFQYYNCGLIIRLFSTSGDVSILINEYMNIVGQHTVIRDILKIIANAPNNVLVYCSWGKDRTGIIACLVLMIAGVSMENIVKDYAMTEDEIYNFVCDNHDSRIPDSFLHAKASYMEQFIGCFIRRYQDIYNYCNEIGITHNDIDLIQRKFRNENI